MRGIGGAPPARSALGLRLGLAAFGVVICAAGAVAFGAIGVWPAALVLAGVGGVCPPRWGGGGGGGGGRTKTAPGGAPPPAGGGGGLAGAQRGGGGGGGGPPP